MSKWFFLSLLAIVLILSLRFLTFSHLPLEGRDNCDSNTISSNLSGIWDLNRIDNFSGLKIFLENENTSQYSFILNRLLPELLSRSQILRINFCNDEITISYNIFRKWIQYNFSFLNNLNIKSSNIDYITGQAKFNSDRIEGRFNVQGVDIEQEIYLDGGELIRSVNIKNRDTGKIKFYYRKYE